MKDQKKMVLFPYGRGGIGGSYFSSAQVARYLNESSDYTPLIAALRGAENQAIFKKYNLELIEHDIHIKNQTGGSRLYSIIYRLFIEHFNVFRAWRLLVRIRPDLVHINDDHSCKVWAQASKLAKVPVVWHVRQENRKRNDGKLIRLADKIICISKGCQWRFAKTPEASSKMELVYNGIDLGEFENRKTETNLDVRRELAIPSGSLIIGFIGNLVPRKRPEWAVETLKHLLKRGVDAHLVMIGEDRWSPRFIDGFSAREDHSQLVDRIHLLGGRDDVERLMQCINVVLVPSKQHGEPFSRVVAEACAAGVPVVACSGVGALELLKDGIDCLSYDGEDVSAFAELTYVLSQDEKKMQLMGQSARVKAQAVFSYTRMGCETSSVYDDLMNKRKHS